MVGNSVALDSNQCLDQTNKRRANNAHTASTDPGIWDTGKNTAAALAHEKGHAADGQQLEAAAVSEEATAQPLGLLVLSRGEAISAREGFVC